MSLPNCPQNTSFGDSSEQIELRAWRQRGEQWKKTEGHLLKVIADLKQQAAELELIVSRTRRELSETQKKLAEREDQIAVLLAESERHQSEMEEQEAMHESIRQSVIEETQATILAMRQIKLCNHGDEKEDAA